MNYKELRVYVQMKKDLNVKKCGYALSRLINTALSKDEELLGYHKDHTYRRYSFDSLYPLAESNIYKAGLVYSFRLRSLDKNFADKLRRILLDKHTTEYFKVIVIDEKTVYQRPIEDMVTLTPAVISFHKEKGEKANPMRYAEPTDFFITSLVSKYNSLHEKKISKDDVQGMFELMSSKSGLISIEYKDIAYIGMKYYAKVAKDSLSQKLAFIAEATGLGEKNTSFGAGFVHANYVKKRG